MLLASFMIHPNEDYLYFRGLRTLVIISFIVISLLNNCKNKLVMAFGLLYGCSSFFTLWYESELWSVISMAFSFLSLMVLALFLYKRLTFKGLRLYFIIALTIVVGILIWLDIFFLGMLSEVETNSWLFKTIIAAVVGFFILGILSFIYTNETNSISSIFFVFFYIFLLFAEMFRGMGYYEFVDSVIGQYAARLLLVISFYLLYCFCNKEKKKQIF